MKTRKRHQMIDSKLLRAGVPIHELNVVRRHLSRIAGGGLAAAAAPARVVTLALSDVTGSALETIGSGPAVPDPALLFCFGIITPKLIKNDRQNSLPACER